MPTAKRVSDLEVGLPTAPEEAETRREIMARKQLSRGGVFELFDRLEAQGYVIRGARRTGMNRIGEPCSEIVYWIEEQSSFQNGNTQRKRK